MFEPHFTSKFKKDYKKADKNPLRNIEDLDQIISKLVLGESLESKYRNHALKGDFLGCRECHIYPDWLLILFFVFYV